MEFWASSLGGVSFRSACFWRGASLGLDGGDSLLVVVERAVDPIVREPVGAELVSKLSDLGKDDVFEV